MGKLVHNRVFQFVIGVYFRRKTDPKLLLQAYENHGNPKFLEIHPCILLGELQRPSTPPTFFVILPFSDFPTSKFFSSLDLSLGKAFNSIFFKSSVLVQIALYFCNSFLLSLWKDIKFCFYYYPIAIVITILIYCNPSLTLSVLHIHLFQVLSNLRILQLYLNKMLRILRINISIPNFYGFFVA